MRKLMPVLLSLALLLGGCGSDSADLPAYEGYTGEVMLYCSMQEEQILAIKAGFEEKYPGITMHYYYANTEKLHTRMAAENQTGNVAADVVWMGAPPDFLRLKADRILSPYISPQAIHINEAFVDPERYYTGARILSVVIAYNTDLVDEEEAPTSWEDLLDPRWRGRIVMSDPGSAGTTNYFMGALMADDRYGEDYFTRLRDNGCALESGSTATHLRVAQGGYAVGVGLDYMVANLAAQGMPVAAVRPDRDLITIPSPIGLVAGCPNERNARLLYDFILSVEGQSILVANNLRSIRDDVQQSSADVQLILDFSKPVDDQVLSEQADALLAAFDRIFFAAG